MHPENIRRISNRFTCLRSFFSNFILELDVFTEALEASRIKLRVYDCVLNILMPHVCLNGASVLAFVG
jgi:hypothetical protein